MTLFFIVFLETAELRAKDRQDIVMDFWRSNVDKIITFNDKLLLTNKGSISNAQMEKAIEAPYEKFDAKRKQTDARQADEQDLKELNAIENQIKIFKE